MSVPQSVEESLAALNSPSNYLVQRYVGDITMNQPMRVLRSILKIGPFGDKTILLLIEGKEVRFQDYSEGENFLLQIKPSVDDMQFHLSLCRLLQEGGQTFVTLKNTMIRSYPHDAAVWEFTHAPPKIMYTPIEIQA